MEHVDTPATVEVKVTPDLLIEKARTAGKNIREIRRQFPKTADAITWDRTLVPDQKDVDDPEVLPVLNIVEGFSYDDFADAGAHNSELLAKMYCETPGYDLKRMAYGLDSLIGITTDRSPIHLRQQIRRQADDINSKVTPMVNGTWKGEKFLWHDVLPMLVEAGKELDSAIQEKATQT